MEKHGQVLFWKQVWPVELKRNEKKKIVENQGWEWESGSYGPHLWGSLLAVESIHRKTSQGLSSVVDWLPSMQALGPVPRQKEETGQVLWPSSFLPMTGQEEAIAERWKPPRPLFPSHFRNKPPSKEERIKYFFPWTIEASRERGQERGQEKTRRNRTCWLTASRHHDRVPSSRRNRRQDRNKNLHKDRKGK